MREIVLDTETTGLDPKKGDRIVEIGCVELMHQVQTGRTLHLYINPERDMPEEAFRIHGLSAEYLSGFPTFAEQADKIVEFLGDAPLVIHNASFDMGFLNEELRKANKSLLPMDRAIDTVTMARRKFPGAQVNLDALCRRYEIDNSNRTLHGALLDSQLLAEVYLELKGGRQRDMMGGGETETSNTAENQVQSVAIDRPDRAPRPHAPSSSELDAHAAFVGKLKNPIWSR